MDALIGFLMTPQGFAALFLIALGLFLIFRRGPLWETRRLAAPNVRRVPGQPFKVPSGVTVAPEPVLADAEAPLYNMMRIAVQEQFLLLAQVPLWAFLDIHAEDPRERHALLKEIAFRRAQFVLVHPGTLHVCKIVEIDDPKDRSPNKEMRNQLLDEVLGRAKIPIVRLDQETEYSVAALAGILGVEPASLDDQ